VRKAASQQWPNRVMVVALTRGGVDKLVASHCK
jgi:hypothetical protein